MVRAYPGGTPVSSGGARPLGERERAPGTLQALDIMRAIVIR